MANKLCDLKKLLKKNLKEYVKYVDKPEFVCHKCGRVANERKTLCKPARIRK